MKFDKPFILPIKEIVTESPRVKSFVFDYDFPGEPGQFVMTWIPGHDEKPFGIVKRDGQFMITVAAVGEATNAMHAMKEEERLGFRGPYGSVFNLPEKGTIALVAGGYGIAPLAYLADVARKKSIEVHLFLGARSKDELVFSDWMKEIGVHCHFATDDGSEGFKGYNTEVFKKYVTRHDELKSTSNKEIPDQVRDDELGRSSPRLADASTKRVGVGDDKVESNSSPRNDIYFDKVFIVGPEVMEVIVTQLCYEHNIPFEVSLERYMKCAIGLCGQCSVDPTGWRMCVEGPVLNQDQLKKVKEYGKYHRSASGKIITY